VQGGDGNFYGTTAFGGTGNFNGGTVFKMSSEGALTSLHSFTGGNDSLHPNAGLVQGSDGNFYGTTDNSWTFGHGTVFQINTNGALTNLYRFTGASDGGQPEAGLVRASDGNFYGATYYGGAHASTSSYGTLFKINTNGALTSLYSFTGTNDGANPQAGLVQGSDGNFFGTTEYGGTNNSGTVFKMSANGVLTSLHSFSGGDDDGNPNSRLVQGTDGNFYGTTSSTVFQMTPAGVLTTLVTLGGASALVQGSDGSFYGATYGGGKSGVGTVFRLTIVSEASVLTILPSKTNLILTWPANAPGYHLQSTTNLGSSVVWNTNCPAPVVLNGRNTVTNPIFGTQQFFRLSQQSP
jgi:uncharacterized repeat protein (TIGR03803 family)